MKKENMKIKEIITFEDKANAIEYICNSLFDFGENGEITDYSPYYIEPAQVCAIINYFVEGIEFEDGESVYDVAIADKEINDIVNQFFIKNTTTAKNPKLTYPQEVMKFVMSHVVEKVEYMKQKAIHAPSYRKDMVGEAIVELINVLAEKANELNVSEANKFIEKYNNPDSSLEDFAKQFMKDEYEKRMEELKENKNESSSIVKDNDEFPEEPTVPAEHKPKQAEEFLAKYKEIERRNKSK
jgi:hypothetical protein